MALAQELRSFFDLFEDLTDPRIQRTQLHPLPEILLATVCGVIAGCDGWSDIEAFSKARLDYLRRYLPFANGAPSDDTFRRVFRALDPHQFQQLFAAWASQWFEVHAPEEPTVAIDGKCLRGSHDGAQKALYMVSAFATEARIVLGQTRVDEKSNEITAIPLLLDSLDLRGATVTIDAMGCQCAIADKIVEAQADFVLGLKGNQSALHDDVVEWFSRPPTDAPMARYDTVDKGHGRIEQRVIRLSNDVQWLRDRHPRWQCIKSIVEVRSKRHSDDTLSSDCRYYVSSQDADAPRMAHAIRSHWGIENTLHWTLDMSFGEDQSRIRKGNAVQNIAVIRHAVINAINQVKSPRQSVKQTRKRAAWSVGVLDSIVNALI